MFEMNVVAGIYLYHMFEMNVVVGVYLYHMTEMNIVVGGDCALSVFYVTLRGHGSLVQNAHSLCHNALCRWCC